MTEIVLRVRLLGGEHLDVAYDEDGEAEPGKERQRQEEELPDEPTGWVRTGSK